MRLAIWFPIALLSLRAQTIEVTPTRVLVDQPTAIRVSGCRPNERITIRAELIDGANFRWVSQSEFVADSLGSVDTSKQSALAGSYKEISAMGPVWSMKPASSKAGRYQPPNVRYPACCGFTSVPYAWTWQGKGLSFYPVGRLARAQGGFGWEIAVEHTHGPILLISGGEDGVWNSSSMTESVVTRLKREHFTYDVIRLNYPHAGHSAGRPEIVPSWQGLTRNPTSGRDTEMGGTPAGNAESSLDAAPKILDFLAMNL